MEGPTIRKFPLRDIPSLPAVARPVADAERLDPRTFQVNQIKRRFSPREETASNGDSLYHIAMKPSDPDFAFDIESLKFTLRVPSNFPGNEKPSLCVTNKEMERGYQFNVEQGFDAIWTQSSVPTLLNSMKALDKQLEAFLTAPKADTIKILANTKTKPKAASTATTEPSTSLYPSPGPGLKTPATAVGPIQPAVKPIQPIIPPKPPPVSPQRREQARKRRETEIQILEHRLGRNPQFSKAVGDTVFNVPIEPRKRNELPTSLQAIKAARIFVPLDYDLSPCTIELLGVFGDDTSAVEKAFEQRARSNPDATLLAQINYLASNMHLMAKPMVKETSSTANEQTTAPVPPAAAMPPEKSSDIVKTDTGIGKSENVRETEKDHVKIITRPPEWDMEQAIEGEGEGSETDESYYTDEEYDGTSDEDGEKTTDTPTTTSSTPQEKGIMVSFPGLELYGIELLELILVAITVKCDRCKDTLDVQRLRPHEETAANAHDPSTKDNTLRTTCKKCAYPFTLAYRKDILHSHSTRAGYLDLDGCTIVDLLPSIFAPTCSNCSTPFSASQGITATRAQSALAICRVCHTKLSFLIPEIKFLRISNTHNLPLKQAGRPKKETLGITAGTELPERGRCKHYGKSYRWFRFSCCNKVFACDKCHDDATDHPNDFANRMICGWCSREQAYRPEDCGMQGCRRGITGRVSHVFCFCNYWVGNVVLIVGIGPYWLLGRWERHTRQSADESQGSEEV